MSQTPGKRKVERMVGRPVHIQHLLTAKLEPPNDIPNDDMNSDYIDSDRDSNGSDSINCDDDVKAEESVSGELFGDIDEFFGMMDELEGKQTRSPLSPMDTRNQGDTTECPGPNSFNDSESEKDDSDGQPSLPLLAPVTDDNTVRAFQISPLSSKTSRSIGEANTNRGLSSHGSDTIVAGSSRTGSNYTPKAGPSSFRDATPPRKHKISIDNSVEDLKPLKRRKVEDLPRSRHWFSGRTVVIQVDGTAFRLLNTQLEKESTYFSELFKDADNAPVDETGTEVFPVEVPKVTKSNFSALLDVIEDPLKYFDATPPLLELLDILLASHLLSFNRWHGWALRQVEKHLSPDLSGIDATFLPRSTAIHAVSVFRTCKLRKFQKRVMYELVRQPGIMDDKNFLHSLSSEPSGRHQGTTVTDSNDALCDSVILSLYRAREQLTAFWAEFSYSFGGGFWVMHLVPNTTSACQMPTLIFNALCFGGISKTHVFDPLLGIQKLFEASTAWEDHSKYCCSRCIERIREHWDKKRTEIWDKLDEWFGLVDVRDDDT
ncbi:hypothetical protein K435DRAFT_780446 [Dendrothele bispora CBS 962.96]|uniref:BTB domain-containing protein n=1 Tax=Dendrothele bispora (strain CBS 962.96) TaxID=1314807 RepID=A0A4S8LSU3_DENBC|nr:hypothetical protein K435DRAFT_780446 [Dendrothele bispora CBS 962.96]